MQAVGIADAAIKATPSLIYVESVGPIYMEKAWQADVPDSEGPSADDIPL
jgi:hypothetical protein